MLNAAFFMTRPANIDRVYGKGRREDIGTRTNLYGTVITEENIDGHLDNLKDLEVVFSTWMMPELTEKRLDKMPSLRAVFYAASTTKSFAPVLFPRGIRLMSAREVNAVPVAEFAVSQILLSCKGYFHNMNESKDYARRRQKRAFVGKGNFRQDIGIIGLGAVGRKTVEMLKRHELNVFVYDPSVTDAEAESLGVRKIGLKEMFDRCYVVSNHAPDIDSTKGMLNGELFMSMQPYATFINTGRGATVREDELMDVLKKRVDLIALLDVTCPEPPAEGSELYTLPNVFLTDHLAGSSGEEVIRMADCCIASFDEWEKTGNMPFEITEELFRTLA